jgi:hypothetical protein
VPGARAVYESLVKKGLTEDLVAHVAGLVAEAQRDSPKAPVPLVSPAEIARVQREQVAAFEDLVAWHQGWAEVFRSDFGYHDLVRLGLVARKGGKANGEDEAEPTEAGPTD